VIPLRDNIHSRSFPIITVLLIAANFYFFYQELLLSDAALTRLMREYGLIPARFIADLAKDPLQVTTYTPLLTNLFLHGGWMHVIGNMWYLWIFGDNVEDYLGKLKFIYFYLLCGVGANLAQTIVDPTSTIPTIGASGAISGILGGYLILFPKAKVSTLIPIFPLFPIIQIPSMVFLVFWFLLQLQSGALSLFMAGANIAWWAHIGGFVAGMALISLMKR
jgi:membrane associated rhomboid family serine protease